MKNTESVEKYLDSDGMAVRYVIDKRSVLRRVKMGLLPKPYYFGTRFPRWSIQECDANDRRLAFERVPNVGVLAATKVNAAKKAEKKAAKLKSPAPAEKPARKHAAAVEQHEEISF